jgi:hypothetical protein
MSLVSQYFQRKAIAAHAKKSQGAPVDDITRQMFLPQSPSIKVSKIALAVRDICENWSYYTRS